MPFPIRFLVIVTETAAAAALNDDGRRGYDGQAGNDESQH